MRAIIANAVCWTALVLLVTLTGCQSSQGARNHVVGNNAPIREAVTLSAECESLLVALKERYKPTEKAYTTGQSLYSIAFPAANGYFTGLIGVAEAQKQLKLAADDFSKSEANAKLAAFKKHATNSLGAGIGPTEWVEGALKIAGDIEAKVDALNEKRIAEAVDNLKTSLARARMGSFETVTAQYLENKYKDPIASPAH